MTYANVRTERRRAAPSAPKSFALERWFAEFEFVEGMRVLSASGAFPPTTNEVLALGDADATARYLDIDLDYSENPGGERLRMALATLYGSVKADDVQVTTGASEAILLLLWSTLQPGDNVVVEDPCYQSHGEVATSLGAEVRTMKLGPEDGWLPDPDKLAPLLDRRTRFVFINHPHNPTGSVPDRSLMEAIVDLTDRTGATLVSDEVFRPIALTGSPLTSVADISDRAVSIGDLSKPWGLAGLRVGWIASHDRALLRRVRDARDYTTICCSGPAEFLAEVAMRCHEALLTPKLVNARANLALLTEAIETSEGCIEGRLPANGYSAFLRLAGMADTRAWCRTLATEDRVLLLPGAVFGERFATYVRVGFGGDSEVFKAGLAAIKQRLQS